MSQINSASRTEVNQNYLTQMFRAKIIVTSNPSDWEGGKEERNDCIVEVITKWQFFLRGFFWVKKVISAEKSHQKKKAVTV